MCALENCSGELKKWGGCIQALRRGKSRGVSKEGYIMSTYDKTVCGAAGNESGLDST